MKSSKRTGTTGEHCFTVAREAAAPFLDSDECSVGVEIELRHLSSTPGGAHVTVTTRVIGCSGRYVDFQVEARDSQELIAHGIHKRIQSKST